MIVGEHTAYTYIYPIISIGLQVLSYVAVVAILYLMGWAIINYIKNRNKPIEPSEKVIAINALGDKIDSLVDEIRRDRDDRRKNSL